MDKSTKQKYWLINSISKFATSQNISLTMFESISVVALFSSHVQRIDVNYLYWFFFMHVHLTYQTSHNEIAYLFDRDV